MNVCGDDLRENLNRAVVVIYGNNKVQETHTYRNTGYRGTLNCSELLNCVAWEGGRRFPTTHSELKRRSPDSENRSPDIKLVHHHIPPSHYAACRTVLKKILRMRLRPSAPLVPNHY